MEANFRVQERMGVGAELLDAASMQARFPSISGHGVDLAVLSEHDAWIDPHAALMGFKRKARALGVEYVTAEVEGLDVDHNAVRAARLSDGQRVAGDVFVNACGAWCAELAADVNLDLPVEPMSRESYYLRCSNTLEPLPFIKNRNGPGFPARGARLCWRSAGLE